MLEVSHLSKDYGGFALRDVSFSLPKGYIMGFLGANGAGKTTTLKCLLNLVKPDRGEVKIFGRNLVEAETEIKQKVSFSLGAFDYYPGVPIGRIARVYRDFYRDWEDQTYQSLLASFRLDENKKVRELSAGMKVKFSLALALSHHAELFLFDEPTSGLDPVARDELLEIFQRLVEDGEKSILFSTHITSDLDKCADYILLIRKGKILKNDTKDELIRSHALISGKLSDLTESLRARMVSCKTNRFGFTGLIERSNLPDPAPFEIAVPNLEDLMVYYNREEE